VISTTYSGTSVFLLPYPPHWPAGVDGTFEKLTKVIAGSTNREEREELRSTLITSISFQTILKKDDYDDLRAALSTWDNRPVLVPFWPAATAIGGTASVVGGLKVWFEPDFTTYEIGTGASPGFTPTANAKVAPLIWGKFTEFPSPVPLNGPARGVASCSFSVEDNSAAAYALGPNTVTLSTEVVNTLTVPILTVPFTWGDNNSQTDVKQRSGSVGYGRESADVYYTQNPRQRHRLQFVALKTADVRHILTLFANRGGSVRPWKCPTPWDPDTKDLARFAGDRLSIRWLRPDYAAGGTAATQIEAITLPVESVTVSGETPGVTIGGLGAKWYGYKVTDGTTTWRYTSYESALAGPGGTFSPAKIEHGTITEEINLQIHDITIEVHNWAGSPFNRLKNQPDAAKLEITIYHGTVASPSGASVIFVGRLGEVDTDGPMWKIKAKSWTSILDAMSNRLLDQTDCAATFGDAKCGKDLSSIQSTQTLTGVTGDVAVFTTGSANAFADHRFALGYAERVISGVTQRYMIIDSYDEGGDLACVLGSKVSPAPTGSESGWVLTPGCGGTMAECVAWSNFVNFRGHPRRPKSNPALVPQKSSVGGKK
jgi:uncharacterized phage protein (TIGR02218 family)